METLSHEIRLKGEPKMPKMSSKITLGLIPVTNAPYGFGLSWFAIQRIETAERRPVSGRQFGGGNPALAGGLIAA
jgi:hypothetical protein